MAPLGVLKRLEKKREKAGRQLRKLPLLCACAVHGEGWCASLLVKTGAAVAGEMAGAVKERRDAGCVCCCCWWWWCEEKPW